MPRPPQGPPRPRQQPQRADPRHLAACPVLQAIRRRPPCAERLQVLTLGELLALQELAAGTAGQRALVDVRDLLLVADELARAGIGPELAEPVAAALQMLRELAAAPAPWHLAGNALQQLVDLQAAHERQRRMASEGELIEASARAWRRVSG